MAQLPDWQPLDGVAPPSTDGDGAGRIVVLVATERAAKAGSAPKAALELARSWSRQGQRVMLVDGALQHPSLHEAARVPNREGLTDAALHGASVARVSRAIEDGSLFLVTAGTPVADTNSVVRSPRWHRLATAITDAGATLMLYLRDGDAGAAAFLGSASEIVVLAEPDHAAPLAVRDLEPMVRAVTGLESDVTARPAPRRTKVARSPDSSGGGGRMAVFVIVAVLVAAGLGFLLTAVLR